MHARGNFAQTHESEPHASSTSAGTLTVTEPLSPRTSRNVVGSVVSARLVGDFFPKEELDLSPLLYTVRSQAGVGRAGQGKGAR